jgi:hypothetical protein
MSKYNFEEFEPEDSGYSAYEPVPDHIAEENIDEYIEQQWKADSRKMFREVRREKLIEKHSVRRFYRFLLNPIGQFYDPGFQESSVESQPELFKTRAHYVLKYRFLQVPFGFYRVEYSLLNNYAISHYSLNNGLTFKKYAEVELRGTITESAETIAELIAETESFLRSTIKEKRPPYLMNMK